jgi:hypothetical protein
MKQPKFRHFYYWYKNIFLFDISDEQNNEQSAITDFLQMIYSFQYLKIISRLI